MAHGAAHHGDEEHAGHVAEAKRADSTTAASGTGTTATLLLPPLHLQPVQRASLLQL